MLPELAGPPRGAGESPSLTPDERTIFFDVPGDVTNITSKIVSASRAAPTAAFGAYQLVNGVNFSLGDNRAPAISADGLVLFMVSDRTMTNTIYRSSRASLGAAFSTPEVVSAIHDPIGEFAPFITADGTELWFFSYRSGNGDIFRAPISNGVVGAPVPVTELNDPVARDGGPKLTADGLTVFFFSSRMGHGSAVDIWTATRASRTSTFGAPVRVDELNDPIGNSQPGWISPDGCRMYMTSDRAPGNYGLIYLAERSH